MDFREISNFNFFVLIKRQKDFYNKYHSLFIPSTLMRNMKTSFFHDITEPSIKLSPQDESLSLSQDNRKKNFHHRRKSFRCFKEVVKSKVFPFSWFHLCYAKIKIFSWFVRQARWKVDVTTSQLVLRNICDWKDRIGIMENFR